MSKNDIKLPKEIEQGNIEYKLKLLPETELRLNQLATQLNWRLIEGRGICLYFIGVDDQGSIIGLNRNDIKKSIINLNKINKINNFTILQQNLTSINKNLFWGSFIIVSKKKNFI